MKTISIHGVLLLALFLAIRAASANAAPPPKDILQFTSCVLETPSLKPSELGSRNIRIQFGRGGIAGLSSAPGKFDVNLLVYFSEAKGRLFFGSVEKGHVHLVMNSYDLSKQDGKWYAGEGNGGVETYRVVGNYATKLAMKAAYVVDATKLPAPAECSIGGS